MYEFFNLLIEISPFLSVSKCLKTLFKYIILLSLIGSNNIPIILFVETRPIFSSSK